MEVVVGALHSELWGQRLQSQETGGAAVQFLHLSATRRSPPLPLV